MSPDAIVLLAYGPRRQTTDAVERAKSLAGPDTDVLVVAATRGSRRPLGTLRSPRVRVLDGTGRAGLAEALARLDTDRVLLLHDDVRLSPEGLASMLAEHEAGHTIVVPWTNDTGAQNFVGALPPTRDAASAIDAGARTTAARELESVRPACLVGDAAQLRQLLPRRLSVARTVLHSAGVRVVAAAGAVAAHDSTCLDQVATGDGPDGRSLVTAMLIVRDEADNLPDCLAAIAPLADRVVVCDTGSTDDSVAVARAHGAEVFEVEWRDDFAWARNQVLDRCRDAWFVLQVDADERLVCDAVELRRLLATDVDDSHAFAIRIDNLGDSGRVHTSHLATRLFRPDGVEYVGSIHEMPMTADGRDLESARLEGIHLVHLGYQSAAFVGREKAQRNLEIARADHERRGDAVSALHFARALVSAGREGAEASELLQEAIDKGLAVAPRAYAMAIQARIALGAGDAADALHRAGGALDLVPADDGAACVHAEAALAIGDPELAVTRAESRWTTTSPRPYHSSTVSRSKELLAVARAHVALGNMPAAADAAQDAATIGFFHDTDGWVDLVSILTVVDPDGALDRLFEGAAADATGGALAAVRQVFGSGAAGPFATRLVAAGNLRPEAIQVGLAWALVTGHQAALDTLTPHVPVLEPAIAERLMEVAAQRGHADVATSIAQGLLAMV